MTRWTHYVEREVKEQRRDRMACRSVLCQGAHNYWAVARDNRFIPPPKPAAMLTATGMNMCIPAPPGVN